KYEVKRMVRGAEREFEVELGDYKEVNGVFMPFGSAIGSKGSSSANKAQYAWERIEANVPLEDSKFAKPGAAAPTQPAVDLDASKQQPKAAEPVKPTEPKPPETKKPPVEVTQAGEVSLQAPSVRVDSNTTSGLGARNIGSAAMSGRIAAIAATRENGRLTVYVGSASGGVWKSTNGGTTYKPVFDKQTVQSIGAVSIDPTNPKVVWVGSGESWMRNSVSIGDGIYRSDDGGENWTNLGLKNSEHIVKILVGPTETNTVYVCVPGKLWSDSDERVVCRTTA